MADTSTSSNSSIIVATFAIVLVVMIAGFLACRAGVLRRQRSRRWQSQARRSRRPVSECAFAAPVVRSRRASVCPRHMPRLDCRVRGWHPARHRDHEDGRTGRGYCNGLVLRRSSAHVRRAGHAWPAECVDRPRPQSRDDSVPRRDRSEPAGVRVRGACPTREEAASLIGPHANVSRANALGQPDRPWCVLVSTRVRTGRRLDRRHLGRCSSGCDGRSRRGRHRGFTR